MFQWKDIYSVGIEEIDLQHRRLFELGAQLYNIVKIVDEVDRYDEIMAVLEELKDYTVYHFKYEEELLQSHGYLGLSGHKKEHTAFVEKILEISSGDVDYEQKKVTMDIIVFIANWIEQHILKTDYAYMDFLKVKGIS